MSASCEAAFHRGGTTVGLLPGSDRTAGNPFLTVALPTGLGELRNGLVVAVADAIIAIGGGWGTLNEVALALRVGKPLVDTKLGRRVSPASIGTATHGRSVPRGGENALPEEKPKPDWVRFLDEYRSYMQIILGAAVVVSLVIQQFGTAALIVLLTVINAVSATAPTAHRRPPRAAATRTTRNHPALAPRPQTRRHAAASSPKREGRPRMLRSICILVLRLAR